MPKRPLTRKAKPPKPQPRAVEDQDDDADDAMPELPETTGPETVIEQESVTVVDDDHVQPALIPMSDDELREAGQRLAVLVRDYTRMEAEHAAARQSHSEDRKKLKETITTLAQTIRQQGR